MNTTLLPVPAAGPSPLLRELLAAEPELARFMPGDELETHTRRFLRQLRLASARAAVEKGDTAT